MKREIIIVLSAFCVAFGQDSTTVNRCTSSIGDPPLNVYIEGCTTPPCILPQLQNVVVNVVFKAPRLMPSLTTLATAYVRVGFVTVPVPYPLGPHANTCDHLTNTYCPVLEGEVVTYTLNLFIEPTFPTGTNADIEFRVVDGSPTPLFCFRAAISIVPPLEDVSS